MTGLFHLVILLAGAAFSEPSHNNPSLVSQDPLMRQILHKQVTQHNGGVTTAVRVASGQGVELSAADPLSPLKSVVPAGKKQKPSSEIKKADEQAQAISDGRKKWR
jgi:hypothetical protein